MANPPHDQRPDGSENKVTSDLASRIAAAKRDRAVEEQEASRRASGDNSQMGRAVRLGSEFIAAVLVGAVIGYLADQWLNTRPWIMLVMLMVGFAAGIVNVTRSVAEMNKAAPPPKDADLGPDDEEDEDL